jgi:hypothetical protein
LHGAGKCARETENKGQPRGTARQNRLTDKPLPQVSTEARWGFDASRFAEQFLYRRLPVLKRFEEI